MRALQGPDTDDEEVRFMQCIEYTNRIKMNSMKFPMQSDAYTDMHWYAMIIY